MFLCIRFFAFVLLVLLSYEGFCDSKGRSVSSLKSGKANVAPVQSFKDCTDCPVLVKISLGSFMMGRQGHAEPTHNVSFNYDLAVGKYEVTFAEWELCADEGECNGYWPLDKDWGRNNRPVIFVSWNDAQTYVEWLSKKTGHQYRLLTEAEWEYIALAGSTTGCMNNKPLKDGKWCPEIISEKTMPVGTFSPNEFGIYDMDGNVEEWIQDCYHDSYIGAPSDGSAWVTSCKIKKTADAPPRITRGANWHSPRMSPYGSLRLPSLFRDSNLGLLLSRDASARDSDLGFRIARKL